MAGRRLGKGSRGTSAAGEAGEEGPQDVRASDVGVGQVGPMTREGAQEISPAWGRGVGASARSTSLGRLRAPVRLREGRTAAAGATGPV